MDVCVWGGMISVCIHKEDGMEDLLRHVSVHGGDDVCEVTDVAIDEFTQTDVIVHGAASAAATDKEFKAWDREGVLRVDH